MIYQFYKRIGETPLQAINRFKTENKEHTDSKISHAGRLDPMAHGILILLVNESCKLQNTLHRVSKTYRFKMLLGVETDTFDILGRFTNNLPNIKTTHESIDICLKKLKNEDYYQMYPPYSSYRIDGKPLWEWSKLGLLDTVYGKTHAKKVNILNYKISKETIKDSKDILKIVTENINKLGSKEKSTFRATDIIEDWDIHFKNKNDEYQIFEMEAEVSSGTYIRSICYDIGKMLSIPSLAFEIERINVNLEI